MSILATMKNDLETYPADYSVKFKYEFRKKSGSVLASFDSKGSIKISDTQNEKPLFWLNFSRLNYREVLKTFRKAKSGIKLVADGPFGERNIQLETHSPASGFDVAKASVKNGQIFADLIFTGEDEEPDVHAMDPGTAVVVIVAIVVIGYLGDKAMDSGAKLDVTVDSQGVTVSIDGGSGNDRPELPDGGGDDDGGGDSPNPGDNSPPPD